MIRWHKELVIDDTLLPDKKKIMHNIKKGKIMYSLYCITIASNENNIFDIINSNELLFNYYKQREVTIVGLASNKKNAIELVSTMVTDVYSKTGNYDIRRYFEA